MDFKDYDNTSPQVKHYRIPVGDFFTGPVQYLTFANDHDGKNPTAKSVFSNVQVYEDGTPTATINFNDHTIETYDESQNKSDDFEVKNQYTHFATIELPADQHGKFDATVSAVESSTEHLELEPATSSFELDSTPTRC